MDLKKKKELRFFSDELLTQFRVNRVNHAGHTVIHAYWCLLEPQV